jgi:hypothetical protein
VPVRMMAPSFCLRTLADAELGDQAFKLLVRLMVCQFCRSDSACRFSLLNEQFTIAIEYS